MVRGSRGRVRWSRSSAAVSWNSGTNGTELLLDRPFQRSGIQGLVLRTESHLPFFRNSGIFHDPIVRCPRTFVHATHVPTCSDLLSELDRRLEEVLVPSPLVSVQPIQEDHLIVGVIPMVPDELSDMRPVLLLHMGVIVLLPGSSTGERDALRVAPPEEVSVDEL